MQGERRARRSACPGGSVARRRACLARRLPLHRAQRIRQPMRRAARSRRLLLALMRCPARHDDQPQPRCDALRPGRSAAAAIGSRARGGMRRSAASTALVSPAARRSAKQAERAAIGQRHLLGVGDGQGEAGALQQAGRVAQFREGRDAGGKGRRAAPSRPRPAPPAGAAACRDRGATRGTTRPAPGAADLDQRAGQVVDPMERQARHHQVEAFGREGQEFLVRRHGQPAGARRHPRREVGRDDEGNAARPQPRRHHAPPAEVERAGEAARRVVQPVEQPVGAILEDGGDPRDGRRRPVAPPAHQTPVEDPHLVHGRQMRPLRAARKQARLPPTQTEKGGQAMNATDVSAARAAAVASHHRPHPRHRGRARRHPPRSRKDPRRDAEARRAGAPVPLRQLPAAAERREGIEPLPAAGGSGRPLRALHERAEPGELDQAARPHDLGRRRRRGRAGAEQGLRADGRRRRPRQAARSACARRSWWSPGAASA